MEYKVGTRSGSISTRAAAIGAMAVGAFSVGALAVGALAIGRLAIRRARIQALDIDELNLRRVRGWSVPRNNENPVGATAITTAAVADEYVSLCRQGKFDEAIARLFSRDHVRIESPDMKGPPVEMRTIDAVQTNSERFSQTHHVHGFTIDGPFMADDRFAVRFAIDATFKPTGERRVISKMDLYTVQDGRVVRSEVYHDAPLE